MIQGLGTRARGSREIGTVVMMVVLVMTMPLMFSMAPAIGMSLRVETTAAPPRIGFELQREDWPGPAEGWQQEPSEDPDVGCFGDHTDDVVDSQTGELRYDPRADLVAHCAIYYDDFIAVGVVVDQATDPMADDTWTSGATQVYWEFDVNGDGGIDLYLAYYPVDGQLRAFLFRPDYSEVCPGQGVAIYDQDLYVAGIPAECLGTPEVISLASVMIYDDSAVSGGIFADSAPTGAGFDGPIVHQLPPPEPTAPEDLESVAEAPPPPSTPSDPTEDPLPEGLPYDADPATTERVAAADPTAAAVAISKMRFDTEAPFVVLSRDDLFADSLAGSSLTRDAPLLFTDPQELDPTTLAEIKRVARVGTTVYILGDVSAVNAPVQETLLAEGYEVIRLAGPSRIETAIAIADQVSQLYEDAGDAVMIARAYGAANDDTSGWADAIAAGGIAADQAIPILLTPTEGLHTAVGAWLSGNPRADTTLLGGTAALSTALDQALPQSRRVAGAERTATAVEIARTLWDASGGGDDVHYVISSAYNQQGWAFGLAAAGLSADHDAPVLLVGEVVSDATQGLLAACGAPQIETVLIGDASVIADAIRDEIDRLDGTVC